MPNRKFTMDPWLSLDKVFNNFNHLIHQNEAGVGPKVHSCKTEDEIKLSFELSGVDPDKLELNYKDDTLSLKGERVQKVKKDHTLLRSERPHGAFERSFILPFKIDEDKVKAQYKNGILSVHLFREASQIAKKITIQTKGAA
jgi:HSP20 family protein